jgi:bacillithiol biosynthesis cysteine-adding enzyme BshC
MRKHCVELQKTGQFSQFFLDYIEGKKELAPFYSHAPTLDSFAKAIDEKDFSSKNRMTLVKMLDRQYATHELSYSVSENIKSLVSSDTFTVTTGHQLNLFTGPLYFIYKIVSTINLAKQLNERFTESHFVPVYWMATEDHDFDEINYFKMDGKKFQWKSSQSGAVGNFKLDDSFKRFLKEVPFAANVFYDAYSSSKTLGEAVRKYVNNLFGDEGLVIVDGNEPEFKREFQSVILSDLFDHQPFKKATATSEQLENIGYKSQIFPREINLFYLDKGLRERIERVENGFAVIHTAIRFTEKEIREKVDTNPEMFSPNVVLRPLYQEMILPNLAYLGGPSEVVYWLQLKGIFDLFKVPFPIILPRNFALIINPTVRRKMKQLDWEAVDLFRDYDKWKNLYVHSQSSLDIDLVKQKEIMASLFDKKGEEAAYLEKTLKNAFKAGKIRSMKIWDQMSRKLQKAEERRLHIQLERALAIQDFVLPGGSPQERVVNMQQFYLNDPDLINQLLQCFDPLDFCMMVLENGE